MPHTLLRLCLGEFVGFGEDAAERNAIHAEHLDEPQVDFLRFEPDIDQYKQQMELLAAQHVAGDEFREFALQAFRGASVAITRQIDQIPLIVDAEMVDKARFARRSRHLGQSSAVGKHIDERRFSHVAAPNESDVARSSFGT